MLTQVAEDQRRVHALIESKSRIVMEYLTKTLAPDSESSIELQPQFQRMFVRIKKVIVIGPSTAGAASLQAQGSVTSPGAAATIAQILLANLSLVTYNIQWTVELDGTPGAGDVNNFRLFLGGTVLATSVNDGAIGRYVQENVQVTVPAGLASGIRVQSIAAGTAGAIYSAQITASPVAYTFTLQLGDHYWPPITLPVSGYFESTPEVMELGPHDRRILTAALPGQYSFELFGYADVSE